MKARVTRGGSRTAAISKMERFVITVNGFSVIKKRSILDVVAVLDLVLVIYLIIYYITVMEVRPNKGFKNSN